MHLRRAFLVVLLTVCGLLFGCSSGDSSTSNSNSDGDEGPPATTEELTSEATTAFASPGTALQTIDSTLPGIAKWTFYYGDSVVAVGTDASGAEKAKFAMLADDAGDITGVAYTMSDDLKIDPHDVAVALNADIESQVPASDETTSSVAPLDTGIGGLVVSGGGAIVKGGVALYKACKTSLVRIAGTALVGGIAAYGVGALALTCETGITCVAAVWGAKKVLTAAAKNACPGITPGIFTSTPAM